MAEEVPELRRINWSECFQFTQVFRTFRLAIHPSILGLALAGILVMGFCGWLLDVVCSSRCRPLVGEVNAFWQTPDIAAWRTDARGAGLSVLTQAYRDMNVSPQGDLSKGFEKNPGNEVKDALVRLRRAYDDAVEKVEDDPAKIAQTAERFNEIDAQLRSIQPRGVFASLLEYETGVVRQMVDAAAALSFTGQIREVLDARGGERPPLRSVKTGPAGIGVLACLLLMARGAQWLVTQHPLYAVLLAVVCLVIWSVFGGAMCRIAALNVARDEQISPKAALAFARRKFVGFLTAPLLPIVLVVVVGVFLILGGLVGAIPYVGEILAGAGMILALVGGFVMALVIVGALAGGSLLYPTIAAEGSDSFDAMSRSYSYVYSKPWRTGFYATVALVYGALTYLFARFFVVVLLRATRFFVGIGMAGTDRPGTGRVGATKLDAMWPRPSFENLMPSAPPFGAEHWEAAGSVLIRIWVFLVVALLCAYLASYYFSGSTIVYFLLRRKVDATDFDDVYLDEDVEGENGVEAAAPAEAVGGGPSAPVAGTSPPPSAPPAEQHPKPSTDETARGTRHEEQSS